jgi:ABC-2 type transport system ATP-binding protein
MKQSKNATEKTSSKQESQLALSVSHLSKSFKLPTEKANGIKQALVNLSRGIKGYREFKVLQDISFEIRKGDFFGIVGRNGSGKSTLLKLISQIYAPDTGTITVEGKLVPFIELGVGFSPELSGRENVYLNGALLGFSNEQVDEMYDDIVKFAELEDFMEQKLKNYSSGMQVRLAFSIAIRADADILVLDEVLAVGDEAFQRKCNEYFQNLKRNKKTVILVTHDMGAVRKYCNKALLLKDGEIVKIGSPDDVANEYSLLNLEDLKHDVRIESSEEDDLVPETEEVEEEVYSPIEDLTIELLSPKQISQDDEVHIKWNFRAKEAMTVAIVMDLFNMDENYYVYAYGSPKKHVQAGEEVEYQAKFTVEMLNNMNMSIGSSVRDEDNQVITFANESPKFIIRRTDYPDVTKPQFGTIYKNGKNAKWLK